MTIIDDNDPILESTTKMATIIMIMVRFHHVLYNSIGEHRVPVYGGTGSRSISLQALMKFLDFVYCTRIRQKIAY